MSGKSAMRTLVHRAANDRFPPDLDIECAAANGRDGRSADLRCQREMTAQVCQSGRLKGPVAVRPG
jgi:hypothetical protein